MTQKNDSVEMSMTFVFETKIPLTTETEVSLMIANKTYIKAILKSEIKVIKLNFDNYQNWTNEMQLLLNAKKL